MSATIICKKCKIELPEDSFAPVKRNKSGRSGSCRDCMYSPEAKARRLARNRRYHAEWAKNNREHLKNYQLKYYQENKTAMVSNSKKWRQENPGRHRELQNEWKKRNIDQVRRNSKDYKARNRDKVRDWAARRRFLTRGNSVDSILDKDLTRLLLNPCLACGSKENICVDHLVPLVRGGRHAIGNMAALCLYCNTSKGSLTFAEWKYSGRPRAVEVFGVSGGYRKSAAPAA